MTANPRAIVPSDYSFPIISLRRSKEHGVSPDAVDNPDPPSTTDYSEAADLMQRQARNILREHAGLEHVETHLFRLSDELSQEGLSNALTSEVERISHTP